LNKDLIRKLQLRRPVWLGKRNWWVRWRKL